MPVLDQETAYNEAADLFRTAWLADVTTAAYTLLFEDVKAEVPVAPVSGEAGSPPLWARFSMRHVDGSQRTFGPKTARRWGSFGFATVQIFSPAGDGLRRAHYAVKVAMRAFRGQRTTSGVVFRRVRFNEIGVDGAWFQTNVIADFEYDEVN